MAAPLIARMVRIVSLVSCLIAVGWFVGFAVEQSKSASAHQQAELNSDGSQPAAGNASAGNGSTAGNAGGGGAASNKHSGLREAIDNAFSTISSPFSGLTSGMSGAWTLHIVDTLLALLVYGFGLGFLARLLRLAS